MYILQLIDNYAATYSLLIIGLFECLTISYVYGKLMFELIGYILRHFYALYVCMYVYILYVCIHIVCMYTYCMYVYILYVCIHIVCMYTYMYVCMYVSIIVSFSCRS